MTEQLSEQVRTAAVAAMGEGESFGVRGPERRADLPAFETVVRFHDRAGTEADYFSFTALTPEKSAHGMITILRARSQQ